MAKIYKTPQLIAGAIYEKHVGSNYHTALCLSVARVSNRDRAIFHDAMDGVQPMLDGEEELAKSKIDPETMTGECFSAPSGS
jgi:hypothetical protein